jgi:hypothetical protein
MVRSVTPAGADETNCAAAAELRCACVAAYFACVQTSPTHATHQQDLLMLLLRTLMLLPVL